MSFISKRLSDIPIEEAHGGSGSRQMIFQQSDSLSSHLEAFTKGYLEPGSSFDWHHHDVDEFFVVLEGDGEVGHKDEQGSEISEPYQAGSVFYAKAGAPHRIVNSGDVQSTYYFIRLDG